MVGPVLRDAFSPGTAPTPPRRGVPAACSFGQLAAVEGEVRHAGLVAQRQLRDLLRDPGARSRISVAGNVSLPCGLIVSMRGRNCWQEQVSSSLFPLLSTRGHLWGGEALGLQ